MARYGRAGAFKPHIGQPIVTHSYSQGLTAALSFVGALSKQVNKPLAATLSFVGALAESFTHLVNLAGTLSFLVPGNAIDYVSIKDITATPATWAGANSVLVSNDTGWRVG